MKIGEISRRLGVSVSTVRFWTSDEDYAQFLSDAARGDKKGAVRVYTEDDARKIATIHRLREQGLTKEQVLQALSSGKLSQDPLPAPPTPEEEEARRRVSLVPISQLEKALENYKSVLVERDRAIEEREALFQRIDGQHKEHIESLATLNKEIRALSQEVGRARGLLIGAGAVAVLLLLGLLAVAALLIQYLPKS